MARYVTKYIKTGGQSLTVPDQSLTVREIIDRFTRGLPCPVYHESQDDDQDQDEDAHMMSQDIEDEFELRQMAIDYEESGILAAGGEPSAANVVKASGKGDQGEPEILGSPEDSQNVVNQ